MRITKKAVSLVLAMLMITSLFTIVPMTVNAAPPDSGTGTGTGGSTTVITPTTAGDDYLTFTAEEANSSVTLKFRNGSNFKYNKNDLGWQDYTKGTQITLENKGDYVRFSGKDAEFNDYNHVSLTGKVAASGSVMSLRLDDNGESQGLINYCYQYMFSDCTSLTQAPELPETTLAKYCYGAMFVGCTNLTKAPALPATTLADNCYAYMFYGCSKIRISDQAGTFGGITYSAEYRIPTTGTGTSAEDALDDMFGNTGGEFTGTPNINTIYYLPAPATPKVAEVNGTQYTSLQDAIDAAQSGDTVTLLADIDFSEVTKDRSAHDRGDELKIDLKDLTLDMDGHTITTVNASVVFTGNGATIENGNFALKHVKADGTTYQAGSYGLCIDGYGVENRITLNDLTVEGGINIWDADVEINTTTATATASNFYAIWAEGDSNVVVNSGTFSDNGTSNARGPIATDTAGTETLVTVKGGTFNATNKVVNAAAPGSVKFEGGTATKPVLEQYCADGYIPEDNGDNTYGVKVGTYVAQVGSTKYESLQDAIDAASSGDTVTLLADIDFSEVTTNRNAHDTGDEVKVDLKDLTLDLNGKTITTVNASVVFTGNGATIENGNFALKHVKADGTTYQAGSYGLCIDGYGVENGITLNNLTVEGGVNIWNADVEINTTTATATASNFYAIWAEGNSNVVVNSGTFSDNGTSGARGPIATDTDTPETLVTVKGGTFNATKKIVNAAAPGSVQIAGGTFTMVVPEEYAAPGFVPSEQDPDTGKYTVVTDTSSPLNPLNVAASAINDGNAFGLKTDYLIGTLIGVQKKTVAGEGTSTQEGTNNMRYVACLDTDLVQSSEDYGFVVAKINDPLKTYENTNISKLTAFWGNGEKTISAKGTYNNVCGTPAYGDPTDNSTAYKYITCAINDVSTTDKFLVRFYVKIGGKYYYAKYSGHDYKYTGCIASWSDLG